VTFATGVGFGFTAGFGTAGLGVGLVAMTAAEDVAVTAEVAAVVNLGSLVAVGAMAVFFGVAFRPPERPAANAVTPQMASMTAATTAPRVTAMRVPDGLLWSLRTALQARSGGRRAA
jgi:hypothetical protein